MGGGKTIRRERKKMYSAANRKWKAVVAVQPDIVHGHGEEPEFLAVIGKKRASPPTQPPFATNERARLFN
jgi:hypothetical protein